MSAQSAMMDTSLKIAPAARNATISALLVTPKEAALPARHHFTFVLAKNVLSTIALNRNFTTHRQKHVKHA